jgi:hypothetical protein
LEQPWVSVLTNRCNAESVGKLSASVGQRFQRCVDNETNPQGCSNPGLKLANAFGVFKLANAFGVFKLTNAFGVFKPANAFGVFTLITT